MSYRIPKSRGLAWMLLGQLACACQQPMTKSAANAPINPPPAPSQPVNSPQKALIEGSAAAAPLPAAQKAEQAAATGAPKKMPPGAQRMTEARTLYGQRCALCHGAHGHGDGVAAANLRPQPRSFAVAAWQQETTDEAIEAIIVKGGAAVGRSMMMPPARDLAGQTDLLQALVAVVRNFGPGGAHADP